MDAAWRAGSVEAALVEHWPGFSVLERGFVVPCATGEVAVELAGLDAFGRLWLVLRADVDEGAAWLAAIELLARARRDGGLFAAELAGGVAAEVKVALVAREAGAELLRRASAVDALVVLDFVHWTRERGTLARVVERGATEAQRARTVEGFLAELAPAPRALAAACVERFPRLDPELELVAGDGGVAWRSEGRVLARLVGRGEELSGATGGGKARRLGEASELETWLASVLVERFGAPAEGNGNDLLSALPEHEPPPALPKGPILTEDELAAFRD